MGRILPRCALLALAALLGSCTKYGVFQDVGHDPHPPRVEIVGVAYTPVIPPVDTSTTTTTTTTATTTTTTPTAPLPDFKPANGFEIKINDPAATPLIFRVRFEDAGGDISDFQIRDRDSVFLVKVLPTAPVVDLNGDGIPDVSPTPVIFTGTSGLADLTNISYSAKMLGAHRMELWADDSHGSRSPKVAFTFNVVIGTP